MSRWQLRLLGEVVLESVGRRFSPERKTAALLTFLALEGTTSRSKLAGLLWPDSSEATARNNLSQVLRRLRKHTDSRLVNGDDLLNVTSDLQVDAALCKVAAFEGDVEAALNGNGELLALYDYDDLPDFADWLYSERERFVQLKRDLLLGEIAKLAEQRSYHSAAFYAEALVALEPVSEEAYRALMRLTYLSGDRSAALRAYHRCQDTLQRELGIAPLPETVALAREINQNTLLPSVHQAETVRALPLSVLRPPVLVGREAAWAQLEAAWAAGKAIFISGEPGVGKTRLMLDFVNSKGPYGLFTVRPGDADIAYAFHTRSWRALLGSFPDLRLEPWVRRELSRLLPELSTDAPPPLASEADKIRLYEAEAELVRAATERGWVAMVVDDLQYIDAASLEAGNYLISKFVPAVGKHAPRTVNSFRTGELDAHIEARLRQMVAAGLAALVEVAPLDPGSVQQLVAGLELPWAEPLAAELSRYTGGNPLFVTETLKSLLESGQVSASPNRLGLHPWPTSGRVKTLLHERLQRLPRQALQLAWAAAVAQSDFDLELAGRVLGKDPLELAAPWQALEAAQIFSENRFSHDLLYEAVLGSVPAPVETLLHRRCADYLATRAANPARVARHYLAAHCGLQAAPFWLEAARRAEADFRQMEAAEFYAQAAAVFEAAGRTEAAFDARLAQADALTGLGVDAHRESVVGKLLESAQTPIQQAKARHAQADLLDRLGRGAASEAAARAGLDCARAAADPRLEARLLNDLAAALWAQDRVTEAAEVFSAAVTLYEELSDSAELAYALNNLGVVLHFLERRDEAVSYLRRAEGLTVKLGDKALRTVILSQLGHNLHEQGRALEALNVLLEAKRVSDDLPDDLARQFHPLLYLGACLSDLARYDEALRCFEQAAALNAQLGSPLGWLPPYRADALTALGRYDEAERLLETALGRDEPRALRRGATWLAQAKTLHAQGKAAQEALARAEALITQSGRRLERCDLLLIRAALAPPGKALELAETALALARSQGLGGFEIAAATRCAQALLALGKPDEAKVHSCAAAEGLAHFAPSGLHQNEVLFTHYRALAACGRPEAGPHLARCADWVMNIADSRIPPESRASFLEGNPVNKAILEAADHTVS